jgi:hypothetical protein
MFILYGYLKKQKPSYPIKIGEYKHLFSAQEKLKKCSKLPKCSFAMFGISELFRQTAKSLFLYDRELNLLGDFLSFNSEEDSKGVDFPKFKVGDIVNVLSGRIVKTGIVTALPLNCAEVLQYREKFKNRKDWFYQKEDNVYLVHFESKEKYGDHDHPLECQMYLTKVPKDEERRLKKFIKNSI